MFCSLHTVWVSSTWYLDISYDSCSKFQNPLLTISFNSKMWFLGSILASYMNQFFKEKVTKLSARTNPDVDASNEYTKKYLRHNPLLFNDKFFRTTDLENPPTSLRSPVMFFCPVFSMLSICSSSKHNIWPEASNWRPIVLNAIISII